MCLEKILLSGEEYERILKLNIIKVTSTLTQRNNRMSFIEIKKAVKGFPILKKENITVNEWEGLNLLDLSHTEISKPSASTLKIYKVPRTLWHSSKKIFSRQGLPGIDCYWDKWTIVHC
ncbi:hypothetical protein H8356DRAFT_1331718 [Neocallimastix lanati (nom. inval.)]|nr:hypothetical protein H8356DRAFT_1331718 [Neocallimastix sp. JGI-2020a]